MIVSLLYSSKRIDPVSCQQAGEAIARAGHELLFIPGEGSSIAAKAYREAGGKRAIAFFPSKGEFGTQHIEQYRGDADELIEDITWAEANLKITQMADIVVVLSIGVGALVELGLARYNYKFLKRPGKIILVGGTGLPPVLEEAYTELGVPLERVASAGELFP